MRDHERRQVATRHRVRVVIAEGGGHLVLGRKRSLLHRPPNFIFIFGRSNRALDTEPIPSDLVDDRARAALVPQGFVRAVRIESRGFATFRLVQCTVIMRGGGEHPRFSETNLVTSNFFLISKSVCASSVRNTTTRVFVGFPSHPILKFDPDCMPIRGLMTPPFHFDLFFSFCFFKQTFGNFVSIF